MVYVVRLQWLFLMGTTLSPIEFCAWFFPLHALVDFDRHNADLCILWVFPVHRVKGCPYSLLYATCFCRFTWFAFEGDVFTRTHEVRVVGRNLWMTNNVQWNYCCSNCCFDSNFWMPCLPFLALVGSVLIIWIGIIATQTDLCMWISRWMLFNFGIGKLYIICINTIREIGFHLHSKVINIFLIILDLPQWDRHNNRNFNKSSKNLPKDQNESKYLFPQHFLSFTVGFQKYANICFTLYAPLTNAKTWKWGIAKKEKERAIAK